MHFNTKKLIYISLAFFLILSFQTYAQSDKKKEVQEKNKKSGFQKRGGKRSQKQSNNNIQRNVSQPEGTKYEGNKSQSKAGKARGTESTGDLPKGYQRFRKAQKKELQKRTSSYTGNRAPRKTGKGSGTEYEGNKQNRQVGQPQGTGSTGDLPKGYQRFRESQKKELQKRTSSYTGNRTPGRPGKGAGTEYEGNKQTRQVGQPRGTGSTGDLPAGYKRYRESQKKELQKRTSSYTGNRTPGRPGKGPGTEYEGSMPATGPKGQARGTLSTGDLPMGYKKFRENQKKELSKRMASYTGNLPIKKVDNTGTGTLYEGNIPVIDKDEYYRSKSPGDFTGPVQFNLKGREKSRRQTDKEQSKYSGEISQRSLDQRAKERREKDKEQANFSGNIVLSKREKARRELDKEIANYKGNILVRNLKDRAKKRRKLDKKIANYEGDIVVRRRAKNVHPSAAYRGGKIKNSYQQAKRYRKRMKRKISRRKNADMPNYLRRKPEKPTYSKEEAEIWD